MDRLGGHSPFNIRAAALIRGGTLSPLYEGDSEASSRRTARRPQRRRLMRIDSQGSPHLSRILDSDEPSETMGSPVRVADLATRTSHKSLPDVGGYSSRASDRSRAGSLVGAADETQTTVNGRRSSRLSDTISSRGVDWQRAGSVASFDDPGLANTDRPISTPEELPMYRNGGTETSRRSWIPTSPSLDIPSPSPIKDSMLPSSDQIEAYFNRPQGTAPAVPAPTRMSSQFTETTEDSVQREQPSWNLNQQQSWRPNTQTSPLPVSATANLSFAASNDSNHPPFNRAVPIAVPHNAANHNEFSGQNMAIHVPFEQQAQIPEQVVYSEILGPEAFQDQLVDIDFAAIEIANMPTSEPVGLKVRYAYRPPELSLTEAGSTVFPDVQYYRENVDDRGQQFDSRAESEYMITEFDVDQIIRECGADGILNKLNTIY